MVISDKTKIIVNVDEMTWDDMRILLSFQGDNSDPMAIINVFDRFVVGGAKAVPITSTQEAVQAIIDKIEAIVDPKNLESASPPTSGRSKKRRQNTSS